MIQRKKISVRLYDLYNLSFLLKNTKIMIDYYGTRVCQIVNSKLIYKYTFVIYDKMFSCLPSYIIIYIFEFSTNLPFLKFQKTLKNDIPCREKK